ncbi:hypothetical protein [Galactobacter caseinivorans]|uniref:Uncharacterized protein n=1 Tax=Galactobacter caseinivorans TaxID=2676123 RepID=A0A496PH78_9MICC|nr:hypothetical protein [Galactobacter caseinivorans]RKW69834.1 hypothetical protein DWQ67_10140 [Galactobacter caseinivorans]
MNDPRQGYHRSSITRVVEQKYLNPDGSKVPGMTIQRNGRGLVHLTPTEARRIAAALNRTANDIAAKEAQQ